MKKINPNDPAFPLPTIDMQRHEITYPAHVQGLTIRAQLAAMMMQSLVPQWKDYTTDDMALDALKLADALIAALNNSTGPTP